MRMIACSYGDGEKECSVNADGELTVELASELRNVLLEAMSSGREVVLDFSEVTGVDLSCIQLVCSACKSAGKLGRGLRLDKPSAAFGNAASAGGFGTGDCASGKRCLYSGGDHG